jgi:hypothetical protein
MSSGLLSKARTASLCQVKEGTALFSENLRISYLLIDTNVGLSYTSFSVSNAPAVDTLQASPGGALRRQGLTPARAGQNDGIPISFIDANEERHEKD